MKQRIGLLTRKDKAMEPGARVRVLDASFSWQRALIGLTGNMVQRGDNNLIYVDLKEHNEGVTNGFQPVHLELL